MFRTSAFRAFLVALAALVWSGTAEAQTYSGGWVFTPGSGSANEQLWLGNGNDYGLHMAGTSRYCGTPGAAYSAIRNVILGTRGYGNEYVTWWITDSCTDGYVRVCVLNPRGQQACSTYANLGWGGRP